MSPRAIAAAEALAKPGAVKRVNLALQGGGSHGAYSWGALDALLEDERIEIAGVSGASAGAMNAVAFAAGLQQGGRQGARRKLEQFWRGVSPISMERRYSMVLDGIPLGFVRT